MSPTALEEGTDPGEQSGLVSGEEMALLTIMFYIETLRMIAFISLDIVMVTCSAITTFVDIPTNQTTINKIFGLARTCDVFDYHPAREVGAILLVFVIVPWVASALLYHYHLKYSYEIGLMPEWLLPYYIASPFSTLAACLAYVWFATNPDDTYGFLAHYIPCLTFRIMVLQVAFQQAFCLIPQYSVFRAVLTYTYVAHVFSIFMGTSVWDSARYYIGRSPAETTPKIYSFCMLIVTIAVAIELVKKTKGEIRLTWMPTLLGKKEKRQRTNGDVNTITFS